MEYVRNTWEEPMFPGMKFSMKPDLPKISFMTNKVKYSITDLRFLNETAVTLFEEIVSYVAETKDVEEISLDISKEFSDSKLNLISDIITSIEFSAKKKGKNGFDINGAFLIIGLDFKETKDGGTVKLHIIKDNANVIYEYAQKQLKENGIININLCDIVIEIVKQHLEKIVM